MSDEEPPVYVRLMEAVEMAQRALDEAKKSESEARRTATFLENELNKARKAFVDHLVDRYPPLADEISRRVRAR